MTIIFPLYHKFLSFSTIAFIVAQVVKLSSKITILSNLFSIFSTTIVFVAFIILSYHLSSFWGLRVWEKSDFIFSQLISFKKILFFDNNSLKILLNWTFLFSVGGIKIA